VCGPGTFFGSGTQAGPVSAIACDRGVPLHPLPEIGVRPISPDDKAHLDGDW
jgi:hypothetical protein